MLRSSLRAKFSFLFLSVLIFQSINIAFACSPVPFVYPMPGTKERELYDLQVEKNQAKWIVSGGELGVNLKKYTMIYASPLDIITGNGGSCGPHKLYMKNTILLPFAVGLLFGLLLVKVIALMRKPKIGNV